MTMRTSGAAHLRLPALSLHRDGVVAAVVGLGAQHAHAPLVAPAEQLQKPPVPLAHAVLHRRRGLDQLVRLQGGDSQMGLQVTLAVRGQTHEAGLQGLRRPPHAHVARHRRSRRRAARPPRSDPLRHLLGEGVLAELRAALEGRVTFGTAGGGVAAAVPVRRDAGEAEAVAAGDGDGLEENLQADAARELHL